MAAEMINYNAWANVLHRRALETRVREPDKSSTIYKIPSGLQMVDPPAYKPLILSLGPYHHGDPDLKAMDEIKWRYLSRWSHNSIMDCLKIVAENEAQTRKAYSEAPHMDRVDWVQMMLLDSCFVLELLIGLNKPLQSDESIKAADPIKSCVWWCPHLLRDMLLLENQLPFFLLEKLFKLKYKEENHTLPNLALDVFTDLLPGKIRTLSFDNYKIHHILHLLYICVLPHDNEILISNGRGIVDIEGVLKKKDEPSWLMTVPSAKNLKGAGVAFRKKTENVKSFLDITFHKGTLEIPPVQFIEHSNSVFRNLIAFEECNMDAWPNILGAYAFLMNCIIDTPADVALLQQEGIIVRALGKDDDIAEFFNLLRGDAVIDRFRDRLVNNRLYDVLRDVQRHCDKKVNKWKASLNYNYFSNPWAGISVIAAIFLFLLTITQTVLAFISYLQPRSPKP